MPRAGEAGKHSAVGRKPLPQDSGPVNTPFAGLAKRLGGVPAGAPPSEGHAGAPTGPVSSSSTPSRAVVRYERKGHGGKEKTRVEQLGLSPKELEGWLRDAKRALGCGGTVEGDSLLFNGDQRERLPPWLEKRGVARITVS